MLEKIEIGKDILEFEDMSHTYILNGICIKSVTQLLNVKFGHKYSDIDPDVLKKAAERGTEVHKAIEDYCKGEEVNTDEVRGFKFLQKNYGFEVVENEKMLLLNFDGKYYGGRFDMIFKINGKLALADIKTTSTLDKEYLAYQLNLYRIGVKQTYGYDIEELYGLHLRGDKRKLVKIPIVEEERLIGGLNEV